MIRVTLTKNMWINKIGSKCYIDEHAIPYIVTGILFRFADKPPQVEVSYFNDAEPKSSWVEGWRITF
jgi:hypothetical protein